MRYTGPRRKSNMQKACEALDPTVHLIGPTRMGSYLNYEVRDGNGVQLGWTEGNERGPQNAWLRAYSALTRGEPTNGR